MKKTIRKRIFEIIQKAKEGDRASRVFDVFIMSLIFLNVVAVMLETEADLASAYSAIFLWFEYFSVAVFTVEYVLRIWSCVEEIGYEHPVTGRIRFAVRPLLLVDLVAILPFYVPFLIVLDLRFLRAVRLLRMARILKIGRYSEALKTLERVLRSKKEELLISVGIVLLILILASSIMYLLENPVQPQAFSSIPKALWWGVATLTTVGYGDIYPVTALGRFFGAIIEIMGIGLFALPAGIIAGGFSEELHSKSKTAVCPHCGLALAHENASSAPAAS
jgi:voltage-gated potassium channel